MQKSEGTRIDTLLNLLGISQLEFAKSLGTTTNAVTNWKKRELGRSVINKIVNAYPEVNAIWLMNGEGEALSSKESTEKSYTYNDMEIGDVSEAREEPIFSAEKIASSLRASQRGIPYYNYDFQLGFDPLMLDNRTNADTLFDIEPYNNCTCWCNARGNSMHPTISSGDMVALKRIDDWSYLISGEVYAIITDNELRTIKRVKDKGDKLVLIPDNKEYEEQEIPKDIVRHLFLVKGVLKSF